MTYNNLPVFNISIDSEEEGLQLVSLVDEPAVSENFLKFNKDDKKLLFATNSEKHIISGVSLLADTPIYRNDDGVEYYVVFTKETIRQLVEKYNKENKINLTSLQHNGNVIDDCVMVESYFIDKERGICPKEFENCPDGSWITSYKVTNEELWDKIKNSGELNGFSVEVVANLQPTQEGQKIYEEHFNNEDFLTEIYKWLQEDFEKKNFSVDKSQLINAIEKRKAILIDEGGSTAVRYYPHSLGKDKGKDCVVLYSPTTGKWSVRDLSTIKDMIVTKDEIGDLDYEDPSYEKIMGDEDLTVTRSVVVSGDRFINAIKNKTWVQITYRDEKEPEHTGYRQCIVVAYGTTHAGNIAIRCFEQFGDSRSAAEGTGKMRDYKIFLLKRILSFKEMLNVAPWTDEMLDSRYHSGGDDSLSSPLIYAHTLGD